MERKQVPYDYKYSKTLDRLGDTGILLASTDSEGKSNVMTIGWGTLGIIWGKPCFLVLVRPSRYTYRFIEESQAFTVNVPSPEMADWVNVCGTRSGRDVDKIAEYDVSVSMGQNVEAIVIDDAPMVYECRVLHHNDLIPANLDAGVEKSFYGGEDYHRVYFGEIVGAYAADSY